MQQPMNQPEPIGGQQAMSQQMVLCPVRFVYETQVLVQPGDQIQPNQTFFINPQNPPPWMQNRPAPAPVVYVQQMPNNMIQSVPHTIDQNQLYLQQNFANYQIRPNMLTQSPQEIRPTMQLANIMPNMVQNVQQNIQTNERNINQNQNTGQMQGNAQNLIRNQIRQMPNANNQQVELQRQVFMNVRPQMNTQMNMARPVMSLNQFQNMQAMANMQNVQMQQTNVGPTFIQNIAQRPLAQNVNAVRPQMIANNVMNVQPVAKVREIPTSEANKTMTNTIATTVPNVRNFAQNYNCRPIQPRARYVDNATTPKIQMQQTPVLTPQHIPVQTAPTQYNPDKNNSHQTVASIAANTTYLNNPNISRKRKSESPDEIHNKITVNPTGTPIYKNMQQGIVITKLCNEIGTNTSPVHKPHNNAQINPTAQMHVAENVEQINQNLNRISTDAKPVNSAVQNENDKLIRNTVFTQARGRVLQDKISESIPQLPTTVETKPPEIIQNTTQTTNTEQRGTDATMTEIKTEKTTKVAETNPEKTTKVAETKPEKTTKVTETKPEKTTKVAETKPEKTTKVAETKPEKTAKVAETKPEIVEANKIGTPEKINVNTNENQFKVERKMNVEQKIEAKLENAEIKEQISEIKDEKVEPSDKIVSKQNILTHVVDGYVIQESSFAFPIRKPLKEKTLYANPKAESEATDALKECMKEEMKNTGADVQLLPFHYLLLNSDKKKEEEEEFKTNIHPFSDLPHATVKSWTVEDLSSHLLKFDWKDTASVFQDHEIDGESLFLVSKTQLVNIGVSEENAEVICEFVKS